MTRLTIRFDCPVCRGEMTDEPCPGCEVADSFDDVPLTPSQQRACTPSTLAPGYTVEEIRERANQGGA